VIACFLSNISAKNYQSRFTYDDCRRCSNKKAGLRHTVHSLAATRLVVWCDVTEEISFIFGNMAAKNIFL